MGMAIPFWTRRLCKATISLPVFRPPIWPFSYTNKVNRGISLKQKSGCSSFALNLSVAPCFPEHSIAHRAQQPLAPPPPASSTLHFSLLFPLSPLLRPYLTTFSLLQRCTLNFPYVFALLGILFPISSPDRFLLGHQVCMYTSLCPGGSS